VTCFCAEFVSLISVWFVEEGRTYPAAVDAAAVPVLMSSCAVASKLVRTTSPANMILFNNGRFVLEVGVGAADEVAEEGLLE
jgi:hypothetical protein